MKRNTAARTCAKPYSAMTRSALVILSLDAEDGLVAGPCGSAHVPDVRGEPGIHCAVGEQGRDVYSPRGAQRVHPGEVGRPGQVDHAVNRVAEVRGGDHHEAAAIPADAAVLNGPAGLPGAVVGWVSVVVGVHFVVLAAIWRFRLLRLLGVAITLCGVAGMTAAAIGAPSAVIDMVGGVLPGVLMLAAGYAGATGAVGPVGSGGEQMGRSSGG